MTRGIQASIASLSHDAAFVLSPISLWTSGQTTETVGLKGPMVMSKSLRRHMSGKISYRSDSPKASDTQTEPFGGVSGQATSLRVMFVSQLSVE